MRPSDTLGTLSKDSGLAGNTISKVNITTLYSYVAIHKSQADQAYRYLQSGKLKERKVHVYKINRFFKTLRKT
ncbi:DbpA RNA binding domain-containing protein [Legionella sp. PATHC035]|nr:DbpA RNA binding domain-containing protein [Legionella sp. PATHC035]